jgi:hypothetical protein
MKKSLRLLIATVILAVTAIGAAAPVKSTTILGYGQTRPQCTPDGCWPDSN